MARTITIPDYATLAPGSVIRTAGSGVYTAATLPVHPTEYTDELLKLRKENEKLLKLVQVMYEDMCKVLEHSSKETPDYHFKSGYVRGIEHRIREIIDDK